MGELARLVGSETAQGWIILAHLGSGVSLAAVRNGKSVDTSMGFTPTAGVPMSTRTGDLDPGLFWYLVYTEKMGPKQFNEMVNFQSGLLGMSELVSDMRDLLRREAHDVRAAEAVVLFCYQVKKWIGSFAAALGGLDTLVFAGGMLRILWAIQTIASRTVRLSRKRTLYNQVRRIAELAECTLESAYDRARIDTQLASVRETFEADSALFTGEEKAN